MKRRRSYLKLQADSKSYPLLKTRVTIVAIAVICLSFAQTGMAATGTVNCNTAHQQIEGFGASGAYYENWLLAHYYRNDLYNILFSNLGLDIYRIRNTYNFDGDDASYIGNTKQIVQAAKARNPQLRIMLSSWSPPEYLKSTGSTVGGTLKKDAYGLYMYGQFGDWWADSLTAWENNDVHIDYASMQNEPDFLASWDSCLFMSSETTSYAGYNLAFRSFYQKALARMGSNMPKLLAPETADIASCGGYINVLDDNATDLSYVYGFAHHLYDYTYSNPDNVTMTTAMTNFKNAYGYKPLFQTEYFDNSGSVSLATAIYTAQHIHNSLVYEGVTSYLYWDLFWGTSDSSTHGLVSFTNGYASSSYTVNPVYYALKHYAYFTDPNWSRVNATSSPSTNLRMTAFKHPDGNQLTIVIINKSTSTSENITLTINDFWPLRGDVYRTSSAAYWAHIGDFVPSQSLSLPASSITTVHFPMASRFTDCNDTIYGGYWREPDKNLDCYVDYEDLQIVADNWLRTDCNDFNLLCNYVDLEYPLGTVDFFDFTNYFASMWMQCYDPQDINCIDNWIPLP